MIIAVLLVLFVAVFPILFILGLTIAIINKEKRRMGLIMMLIAITAELIGYSICSSIFRNIGNHREEKEVLNENSYKPDNDTILNYIPTNDTLFCDPNQIVATDNFTGYVLLTDSNQVIHYDYKYIFPDTLELILGKYHNKGDSLIIEYNDIWKIPFTSQEMHSLEKLDFKNSFSIEHHHSIVLIRNRNCDSYIYKMKVENFEFYGFVLKMVNFGDVADEIKALSRRLFSHIHLLEINKKDTISNNH